MREIAREIKVRPEREAAERLRLSGIKNTETADTTSGVVALQNALAGKQAIVPRMLGFRDRGQGPADIINLIRPDGQIVTVKRGSLTPERIKQLQGLGFTIPGI